MARVVEHLIYETQEEHDTRIRRENARFDFTRKRSRSRTRNVGVRRTCFRRADSKCEVCRLDFSTILILHHIMPVKFGGRADVPNLVVLCPNCHALVHNYSHYHNGYAERKYPFWKRGLARIGLDEAQADRLIMIASKDARILDDGSIERCKYPSPLVSIIVDEDGKPVDPRHDPSRIRAAIERIEKVFGVAGSLPQLTSPVTPGD